MVEDGKVKEAHVEPDNTGLGGEITLLDLDQCCLANGSKELMCFGWQSRLRIRFCCRREWDALSRSIVVLMVRFPRFRCMCRSVCPCACMLIGTPSFEDGYANWASSLATACRTGSASVSGNRTPWTRQSWR